jgi:hypothetical protein
MAALIATIPLPLCPPELTPGPSFASSPIAG